MDRSRKNRSGAPEKTGGKSPRAPRSLGVSDEGLRMLVERHLDGVLLVVKGGETPYPIIQAALRKVGEVGGTLLGVVLNNVTIDRLAYHGYYSKSYAANEEWEKGGTPEDEPKRPRLRPIKVRKKGSDDVDDKDVRVSGA